RMFKKWVEFQGFQRKRAATFPAFDHIQGRTGKSPGDFERSLFKNQRHSLMKKINQLLIYLFMGIASMMAQTEPKMLIQPYLQDAEPNSVTIRWETAQGEESIVGYGTSPKLGKKAQGKAEGINCSASRARAVKL